MSIKVMSIVWDFSQHKGNTLIVLLAIADFANERGEAWPSIEKLRQKARISERQAIRIIKKLEVSGELKVKHRRHVGNYYMIMLDVLTDKMTDIESDKTSEKESVRDLPDPESQLESESITDSAESVITDMAMSDDPSLTVKREELKSARVDSALRESEEQSDSLISSEDSRISAGEEHVEEEEQEVTEDNILEWFKDKENAEIESGVRSPAEELPKVPRTAEDIKTRVRAAVIANAKRNEDFERNPVIESYLATVPEHVRELARIFCYHKKRPPLKKEDPMWRREWQDQFDIGVSAENVEDAITYMSMNNLGVRSPMSTLTIAENIRLGHVVLERGMGVKSGEVSYDLPSTNQVETVSEEEVSPMEQLIGEDEGDAGG